MPVADVTKRIRYYVSSPTAGTLTIIDGFTNNIVQNYTVGLGANEIVITEDGTVYVASYTNDVVSILCLNGDIRTLSIPNNGYLDVDLKDGKLYVSDTTKVNVYDKASGLLTGTITGFVDVQYLKLTPKGKKLLVLDNNSVKIYSTSTLNLLKTIPVGLDPNYILIGKYGKRAFVSNTGDDTISVLDLIKCKTITTIDLPAGSSPMGLARKGTVLYVANNGTDDIAMINTINYEVSSSTIPTAEPIRLSVTPDGAKLLATNGTGDLTIIDIVTEVVEGSIGLPGIPFDVESAYFDSPISPGNLIDLTDCYQLDDITEAVCVITKKVFTHCQTRDCQRDVCIELPPECVKGGTVESIKFKNGIIRPGTLVITPLPERPNFSRVQFTIDIPVEIKCDGQTVNSTLLPIYEDIVLFIPDTRDEFDFDIVIETRTNLLNNPKIVGDDLKFAAGVFIVIKVVGEVQLLIPAFGYCPEPPECEKFRPDVPVDVCKIFLDFTKTPFPEDFFPPQYEDINCKI